MTCLYRVLAALSQSPDILSKARHCQISVDPADYNHVIFTRHFLSAYDHAATIACQRATKAVAHSLNNHGILADVYIDDFYGAATPN